MIICVASGFEKITDIDLNHAEYFKGVISDLIETVGDALIKVSNDGHPGSYGRIQLMENEHTPIAAHFDIFPSGYVYSTINDVTSSQDSRRSWLKFIKSL